MATNKSKDRAYEIIEHHLSQLTIASDILLSVILVGSLSNDSYSENLGSDIDLIHVLKDTALLNAREIIIELINKTELETNKDIPISKCVYKYSDLFQPFFTNETIEIKQKDYIEIPIEIFRIKESGKTLLGKNIIRDIDMPTKNDVVKSFSLSKELTEITKKNDPTFAEQYEKTIANPTIRMMAQIILTNAMKHYYFYTGKSCSSKLEIVDKMNQEVPGYQFAKLLSLCVKWRYQPNLITTQDEAFMKEQYQLWRVAIYGKGIDFVPLSCV